VTAPTLTVHDRLFELDQRALRCPHATFHRIREEAPVAYPDRLQCYLVTRYEDVVFVLRSPTLFSSAMASGPSLRPRRWRSGSPMT
jgi:cytochrome P450